MSAHEVPWMAKNMTLNLLLSGFPGVGLLDRAFEEAGFCVVRGKVRALANGVPLPMGRAVAHAVVKSRGQGWARCRCA